MSYKTFGPDEESDPLENTSKLCSTGESNYLEWSVNYKNGYLDLYEEEK
jgi:hypothetical protein